MTAREKAQQYRAYAVECRALAKRAADDFVQISLLRVAEAWDELAHDREEMTKRRDDR